MKTKDLIGAALDWAVAAALAAQYNEDRVVKVCRVEVTTPAWIERENSPGSAPYYHRWSPSSDWAQGGPIIEREFIELRPGSYTGKDRLWAAWGQNRHGDRSQGKTGPTALIAAMRCYVASKLGDEVEIPEELR